MEIAFILVSTLMVNLPFIGAGTVCSRPRARSRSPTGRQPQVIYCGLPGPKQYRLTEIIKARFAPTIDGNHGKTPSPLYWTMFRIPEKLVLFYEIAEVVPPIYNILNRGTEFPLAVSATGWIAGFYTFRDGIIRKVFADDKGINQLSVNINSEEQKTYFSAFGSSTEHNAVVGSSPQNHPVFGSSPQNHPVFGSSSQNHAVFGSSSQDHAVFGNLPQH